MGAAEHRLFDSGMPVAALMEKVGLAMAAVPIALLTVLFVQIMLLMTDMMFFTKEDQFVFDPDYKNWERRNQPKY